MARTFWDGFDSYPTQAVLDTVWPSRNSDMSFLSGRFGGQSIRFSAPTANLHLGKPVTPTDRQSIGVACRPEAGNHNSVYGWGFCRGGAYSSSGAFRQISFNKTLLGAIRVTRGNSSGATLWESADGVWPLDNWSYIGFSAIIDPTNGSFSVTLNGEQLVEMTGINTRGQADNDINYVCFTHGNISSPSYMRCDDVYFDDSYMAVVPERRVEILYPTGDGATLDLTPSTGTSHFALVDEPQMSAVDFLSGSTPGQLDELILGDLSNIPTGIDGVKVVGYGNKTDAAPRAWNYGLRTGGAVPTDALGDAHYLAATVSQNSNFQLLNPETGLAWTAADVNALKLLARVAI